MEFYLAGEQYMVEPIFLRVNVLKYMVNKK